MTVPCSRCGFAISTSAKFCSSCGARVTPADDSPSVPGRRPSDGRRWAERRQLTVMFCDIAGSTQLSEQLDPEDLLEVVRRYQATCAGVIEGLGGSIAQYLGDGLLAYFGHPTAYENAPERAARAGVAILDSLGPLNEGLERDFHITLELRLGIHTGLVVIGEMGGGSKREQLAVGDTANIAARLQGLASSNSIVTSEATRQLIEGLFEVEPLGPQVLQGIASPMQTHRLLGLSAARHPMEGADSHTLSPFVGRAQELDVLQERWQQAQAGQGSATLLTADPGCGKSRLVLAFKAAIGERRCRLHEAYCSPFFSHSALYPIVEMLRAELDLDPGDPAGALDELRTWTASSSDALPLLASLLEISPKAGYDDVGLRPQARHLRMIESLLRCLLPKDDGPPTLLVLEDLHWVDPSTVDLVQRIIERLPHQRMMLVMTARSFESPWIGVPHVHTMHLRPFDEQDTRALILGMTKDRQFSPAVLDQLVRRTDGIALFIEEMTRMLLGQLEDPDASIIPTTLRDSLAARIDRVAPRTRELARLGATIGREFDLALLRRIFPGEDAELRRGIEELLAVQLVHPVGTSSRGARAPQRYAFKHALIQDAAYESLLKRTRQEYHGRIADALQDGLDHTAEAVVLAQHLEAAGRERYEEAARQWLTAGIAAHVRSSDVEMFNYVPQEAIDRLQRGLKLLGSLSRTPSRVLLEVRLLSKLGTSLNAIKGNVTAEVDETYDRMHALCEQLDQVPERFWQLWRIWSFYLVKGTHTKALSVAEQLLESAREQHDDGLELEACFAAGLSCFFMGDDLARARHYLEEVVTRYDRDRHHLSASITGQDVGVTSCCVSALLHFQLGDIGIAMQRYEQALALSESLGHPFSRAYALGCAAWLQIHARRWPVVEHHARASVALSQEHGFAWWMIWGAIIDSRAGVERNDPDAAARIDQALTEWREAGSSFNVPCFLTVLAEARLGSGELETAAALLDEAQALAEATGERFFMAEILRLRGTLQLARGDGSEAGLDEAEASFRAAMAVAHTQGSYAWELRAAVGLARLLQRRDRLEQARAILTQCSLAHDDEWTHHPDGKVARALLDELQP